MPIASAFLLIALFVLLGNVAEAVTGFGATILALTLSAHVRPVETLVPVLVPLNVLLSLYLVGRYRRSVDARELFFRILPLSALGLPIGYLVFRAAPGPWLAGGYGLFVLAVAIYRLIRMRGGAGNDDPPGTARGSRAAWLWLLAGGVMQGLFASGGPLIVLYTARRLPEKGAFRATMSALWLVLNLVLSAGHAAGGTLNAATLRETAALLPSLVLGIAAGEWLHRRIPARGFLLFVYALLAAAGLALVARA